MRRRMRRRGGAKGGGGGAPAASVYINGITAAENDDRCSYSFWRLLVRTSLGAGSADIHRRGSAMTASLSSAGIVSRSRRALAVATLAVREPGVDFASRRRRRRRNDTRDGGRTRARRARRR